jgi:hypothetical protein
VNLMEGKYHMTPGGPHVDEGPHDVCFLVTTARYQEAQRTLSNFVNSPLIPESVKERLLAYRVAVNNDFELMIKTLDRFMNAGDDFFLKSEDYGQPKFNGVIQREYFSLFVQLKPKADDVSHELAKYLGTT